MELVDTRDLESRFERSAGSSPAIGIMKCDMCKRDATEYDGEGDFYGCHGHMIIARANADSHLHKNTTIYQEDCRPGLQWLRDNPIE